MTGPRLAFVAALALGVIAAGCGSTSPAPSQSDRRAATGAATSQTAVAPQAQIAFTGGESGTLNVDPAQSECQLLPTGAFTAQFDGVLPGTQAAFTVNVPTGTHALQVGSDDAVLDTNGDSWAYVTSGTAAITITDQTATGMIDAVIEDATTSGVAALHVSASFTCGLPRSGG